MVGPSVVELLQAEQRVVPFDDADGHLETLVRWAEGSDALDILELVGPNGSGKTRLGVELCAVLRRRGWAANFVAPGERALSGSPSSSPRTLRGGRIDVGDDDSGATEKPRLVIIDDSALRVSDVEAATSELLDWTGTSGRQGRLLLLSRTAAPHSTTDPNVADGLRRARLLEIDNEFLSTAEQRRAHVDAAVRSLSRRLSGHTIVDSTDLELPGFHDDLFRRPLYLQMAAAVVAVGELYDDQCGRPCHDPAVLVDEIVDIEDSLRWSDERCPLALRGDRGRLVERRRLITLANLLPVDSDDRLRIVVQSWSAGLPREAKRQLSTPHAIDTLCDWLSRLYPTGNTGFARLTPSVVAEHLTGHYLGYAGLKAAIDWVNNEDDPVTAASALSLLSATLTEGADYVSDIRPWLAESMGGVWGFIADAANDDTPHRTRDVGTYADALASLIAADPILARDTIEFGPDVPSVLLPLAVVVKQCDVDELASLSSQFPDRFQPDLALALNNLGIRLSTLGRRDEALDATAQSVEIYDIIAARDSYYIPNLASALNNLGIRYSEIGRHRDALEATRRAARIRAELAESDPARYAASLASALNNLSVRYRDLGRNRAALRPIQHSVRIFGGLARKDPAAHLPNLAMALNNLGVGFIRLGLYRQAAVPMQRAIRIYEALAMRQPELYNSAVEKAVQQLDRIEFAIDHPETASPDDVAGFKVPDVDAADRPVRPEGARASFATGLADRRWSPDDPVGEFPGAQHEESPATEVIPVVGHTQVMPVVEPATTSDTQAGDSEGDDPSATERGDDAALDQPTLDTIGGLEDHDLADADADVEAANSEGGEDETDASGAVRLWRRVRTTILAD